MKLPLLFVPLIALALPSCEDLSGGYGGGGYGGGGYDYSPSSYSSFNSGYGYRRPYYGGSYYGRDYDHDHNHSSHSGGDDRKIKLIHGNDGSHPNRPEGYHSVDWYKKNDYNLKKYDHKHEDGTVHKGGSSSHKKDDDKKHHH